MLAANAVRPDRPLPTIFLLPYLPASSTSMMLATAPATEGAFASRRSPMAANIVHDIRLTVASCSRRVALLAIVAARLHLQADCESSERRHGV